jgi:uncharacterized DUF497 family protein
MYGHSYDIIGRLERVKRLEPVPASPEILEKIEEKHGIDFLEVEELFARKHLVLKGPVDQYGERRYTSLGKAAAGRYLFVIYTISQPGVAKVITAREMMPQERRYYLKNQRRRRWL